MNETTDVSTNAPPLRFAVLHHSGIDTPHFDLLFETTPGSALTTFRLTQWPPAHGDDVIKLRDHRRFYLTHEGPVPGDRGRVDRLAEGKAKIEVDRNRYRIEFALPPLKIRIDRADGENEWIILLEQ